MDVTHLELRSFRNHKQLTLDFGPGLNVLVGPIGSGKTSVLEAIHVGCTGRSFRTSTERELVRFGDPLARVALSYGAEAGMHRIEVVLQRSAAKVVKRDGATVSAFRVDAATPRVCVFAPDHLELVKGPAGVRRAHLVRAVAGAAAAGRAAGRLDRRDVCAVHRQAAAGVRAVVEDAGGGRRPRRIRAARSCERILALRWRRRGIPRYRHSA